MDMTHTLTLVAVNSDLADGHISKIAPDLEPFSIEMGSSPKWLSDHKAFDIEISKGLNIQQMQALRDVLANDKIDIFCTRTHTRRKKVLLADMDSTIVTTETLDELAAEAGIKDQISEITERAMRGELDFHAALHERIALLKGLSVDALTRTLDDTQISQGAAAFIATMNKNGAFTALVSGGFTYFTRDIADKLGFQANHGNILDIKDGALCGTVSPPILDKDSKLEYLKTYCAQQNVDISESVAIGDGANDLPMLEAAGLGIGYHPKPLLEEKLLNCIRFTDLTSALYMQGYSDDEIIRS